MIGRFLFLLQLLWQLVVQVLVFSVGEEYGQAQFYEVGHEVQQPCPNNEFWNYLQHHVSCDLKTINVIKNLKHLYIFIKIFLYMYIYVYRGIDKSIQIQLSQYIEHVDDDGFRDCLTGANEQEKLKVKGIELEFVFHQPNLSQQGLHQDVERQKIVMLAVLMFLIQIYNVKQRELPNFLRCQMLDENEHEQLVRVNQMLVLLSFQQELN